MSNSIKRFREGFKSKMNHKSWIIPYLSMIVGVGFTVYTFVTGIPITEAHVSMLNYLLMLTLGSGTVGMANKGFKRYLEYKNNG